MTLEDVVLELQKAEREAFTAGLQSGLSAEEASYRKRAKCLRTAIVWLEHPNTIPIRFAP